MQLTSDDRSCLEDLGCYLPKHAASFLPCEMARRYRVVLLDKLFTITQGNCNHIVKVGDTVMDHCAYIDCLRRLIDWTYDLCKKAAEEEGPFLAHVAKTRCYPGGCSPRKLAYDCECNCGSCDRCTRLGCPETHCDG